MTTYVMWAGGVAGALAAIGTVLRYALRYLVSTITWTTAISGLPPVVADLSQVVAELGVSVETLSRAVDAHTATHHHDTALHLT